MRLNLKMFDDKKNSPSTSGFDVEKKELSTKSKWVAKDRKIFAWHILRAAIVVLIAIWIIACWIFGAISKQSTRAHNLKILLLDLDGGDMGELLLCRAAWESDG